jgi:Fe-Mn family superoxide dismutase
MYSPKDYSALLGLPGMSDTLLNNHFTLYQGYVTNTNKVAERLEVLRKEGQTTTAEYMELKRRFGWEFNGMRLPELYFENMSKAPAALSEGSLKAQMVKNFGSYEEWEKDFLATGAMRGIGWVILAYDKEGDVLFNTWINEHDLGHLATAAPLLIMDVFEHAFMIDYGLKRVDYLAAFMKALDWSVVEKRFA